MGFVVAVDGPAGSGKGTITKLVGKKRNLVYIDTGALYRCVTLYIINNNIELNDITSIKKCLNSVNIEFKKENGQDLVFLNGEDVTRRIREKDVDELVSPVSHIVIVRENITTLSRKIAEGKYVIMEGRDIGTNVFPNADVKIYLDATPEERAKRRFKQNREKGIDTPYEEILKSIIIRDKRDKTSNVAPLKQAEDAILIDSTNMTIEEVVNRVIKIIDEKKSHLGMGKK